MKIHEQIAKLSQQAFQLYNQGSYQQGVRVATQAYNLACQHLNENDPYKIESLCNLANFYRVIGNYAQAEPLLHQSLKQARAIFAAKDPKLVVHLNSLGKLYTTMGRYTEAEDLYKEALEINRSSQGEAHSDYASSLNRLAALYQRIGRYDDAEPLYQQALGIYRQTSGPSSFTSIYVLNNLGALYKDTGRYEAAERYLRKALKITRLNLGGNHPQVAFGLNNLAELYREMGRYKEAEPLYQEAIELTRTTLGESHSLYAQRLNNLATLYRGIGKYDDSELLYQKAIKIQKKTQGKTHPNLADTLNNLAGLYRTIGNFEKALKIYQDILEIRRSTQGNNHPNLATAFNDLAVLYREVGQYFQAEQYFQQAQAIWNQVFGDQHPKIALALHNLAGLYRKMRRYTDAQKLLEQALEIRLQTLGECHPQVANNFNSLGLLAQLVGNYATAKSHYEQALNIQRHSEGDQHPHVAITLSNLATLDAATAQPIKAIARLEEAEVIDDLILDQVFSISSESQRMGYIRMIQKNLSLYLSLVAQNLSGSHDSVAKSLKLVFRRKGIGAEALVAQRDAIIAKQYPALAQKLQSLRDCRMKLARKTLAGPGSEGIEAHQQILRELNEHKVQLEEELAREIPAMRLSQKLQAVDFQEIAKALPEGAALVEFVYFRFYNFKASPAKDQAQWEPARYAAFILLADNPDEIYMLDLGPAEEIERMIAEFRASITGEAESRGNSEPMGRLAELDRQGKSTAELSDVDAKSHYSRKLIPVSNALTKKSDGQDLSQSVFTPLLEKIGDRKQLFIAPDGDLSRLPFEVLPIGNGERLIDQYHISYLSTGRDILRWKMESEPAWGDDVVAANPDYRLRRSRTTSEQVDSGAQGQRYSRALRTLHFAPLPDTRKEGEQVAKLLGVEPWLEEAVLESHLKALFSPRILHLATHGFFLPNQTVSLSETEPMEIGRFSVQGLENPLLRSGLALAGAQTWLERGELPEEAEDGILTAEDVSGLNLLHTELVVLSACETGLGEVKRGEGVFGLRRAFMLSGAKTLVMSLWKVPDRQTQELMTEFYTLLLQGWSRADALREAQLKMKRKHSQPFFWGAFICQGDVKPLLK